MKRLPSLLPSTVLVQRPNRAIHARARLSLHNILNRVHFRHKQDVRSVCAGALGQGARQRDRRALREGCKGAGCNAALA
ncbi:hypothetical protein DF3PA_320009 [Candidatus Defluviicoccus seviourii]|uniref:Uncharacterized protein n=2 Tax=root TaxID=1 RepID=A0A564WEU3_9PROT|nr:hypothetical protein DF3PB_5520003 [uncultured Defluviicoccus sp.]VUX47017.1 hypothetical protein DF3PA_320009 [Candidatus Defluviicoccus seviourii]